MKEQVIYKKWSHFLPNFKISWSFHFINTHVYIFIALFNNKSRTNISNRKTYEDNFLWSDFFYEDDTFLTLFLVIPSVNIKKII